MIQYIMQMIKNALFSLAKATVLLPPSKESAFHGIYNIIGDIFEVFSRREDGFALRLHAGALEEVSLLF